MGVPRVTVTDRLSKGQALHPHLELGKGACLMGGERIGDDLVLLVRGKFLSVASNESLREKYLRVAFRRLECLARAGRGM